MARVVWNDIYSVNVTELDNQHRGLVDFINQAYDHLDTPESDTQFFTNFFDRLIDHATFHFSAEEKYFQQFNFPESEAHVAQHNQIKSKVINLQSKYSSTHNINVIFDTLQLLDDWIFNPIMEFDKKYVKLFNDSGLS